MRNTPKIVIAPDKFKGTLVAAQVAHAIRSGVVRARPDARCVMAPMGDGGEGSGEILAALLDLQDTRTPALDALGRVRDATWWRRERTAVVELAEVAGLSHLRPTERNPLHTTSFGVGEVIAAAAQHCAWVGPESATSPKPHHAVSNSRDAAHIAELLICVGGSATVDGGLGCLQALGWTFFREDGAPIQSPARGIDLVHVAGAAPARSPISIPLTVLCDVTNPLLGKHGAARVFGPQKGADPPTIRRLELGLEKLAACLQKVTAVDVSRWPSGGAAGGIAAGLAAACGARLCSGFEEIARHADLAEALRGASLCVTGEGRIDRQTPFGKVVAGVGRWARLHGVRTLAVCGSVEPPSMKTRLARRLGLDDLVPCAHDAPASTDDIADAVADWIAACAGL